MSWQPTGLDDLVTQTVAAFTAAIPGADARLLPIICALSRRSWRARGMKPRWRWPGWRINPLSRPATPVFLISTARR